jgi:Fe-S-cluster containining protein
MPKVKAKLVHAHECSTSRKLDTSKCPASSTRGHIAQKLYSSGNRFDMDCQTCGACCAKYRVSFYWAEADDGPDGADDRGARVPAALTEPLTPHLRCMRGTSSKTPRCIALEGDIGRSVGCGIYDQRPSVCREVMPGDPQCLKARAEHGIA